MQVAAGLLYDGLGIAPKAGSDVSWLWFCSSFNAGLGTAVSEVCMP